MRATGKHATIMVMWIASMLLRATHAQWLENSQTSLTGFCLTSEQGRVRTVLGAEGGLYKKNITINAAAAVFFNVPAIFISQILLSEVYGYNVNIFFNASDPVDSNTYRILADGSADIDPMHPNFAAAGEQLWYDKYVTDLGVVTDAGAHLVTLQSGVYYPTVLQHLYPNLILNDYQQYQPSKGADAVTAYNVFKADTWKTANVSGWAITLNNPMDTNSGYVCLTDSEYEAIGFPPQGCGTQIPGMFVPTQCSENPQRDCAVIFGLDPQTGIPGILQSLISNFNLNFSVAFIGGPTIATPYSGERANLGFGANILAGGQFLTCSDELSNTSYPCLSRLDMGPTYTDSCAAVNTGSAYSSYNCDFPVLNLQKYSRSDLQQEAPRVYSYMTAFKMSTQAQTEIMQALMLQMATTGSFDIGVASCEWLQENTETWQTWMAPPAPCSETDYAFTTAECLQDNTRTLRYLWTQPKACVGGVVLPQPQFIPCAYPAAASVSFIAYTTVYALCSTATIGAVGWWFITSYVKKTTSSQGIVARRHEFAHLSVSIGVLLLYGVVLTSLGNITSWQCWSRHSLMWIGTTLCLLPLAWRTVKIHHQVNRKLSVNKDRQTLYVGTASVCCELALFASVAYTAASQIGYLPVYVEGGGYFLQPYCSVTSEYSWLLYLLIGTHALAVAYIALLIAQASVRVATELITIKASATNDSGKSQQLTKQARVRQRRSIADASELLRQSLATITVCVVVVVYCVNTIALPTDNQSLVLNLNIATFIASSMTIVLEFVSSASIAYVMNRLLAGDAETDFRPATNKEQLSNSKGGSDVWNRHRQASSFSHQHVELSVVSKHGASWNVSASTMSDREFDHLAGTLSDPVARLFYRRYMDSSLDGESLLFLDNVEEYVRGIEKLSVHNQDTSISTRQSHTRQFLHGVHMLMKEAERIMHLHILPSASEQVNISHALVQSTKNKLETIRKTMEGLLLSRSVDTQSLQAIQASMKSVFSLAVKEVRSLLSTNSWPRFVSSKSAQEAESIINWCWGFDSLDHEQQIAVLQRLKQHLIANSSTDDVGLNSYKAKSSMDSITSYDSLESTHGRPTHVRRSSVPMRPMDNTSNVKHGNMNRSLSGDQSHFITVPGTAK